MLTDLVLQDSYRSGRDALLTDFYVPCLQESLTYDRAVGFFRSSLMHVVALAYSDFARRAGRMRLICSPALTPDDFEAIRSGEEIVHRGQEALRAELRAMLSSPQALPATKLLATLVATDILEVRIAFSFHPSGIFHDKLGIFSDAYGRRISFVGSANETWTAWGLNHESFEVFCSWKGERELLRTRNHAEYFDQMWLGREPHVRVDAIDAVTREQLLSVAEESLERAVLEVREPSTRINQPLRTLLRHQLAVIENWRRAGYRGVVSFATGAGKTLTAIEGIRRWTASGRPSLVLVPSRELHRQWIGELQRELPHARLLLAGAGAARDEWMCLLPTFLRPGSTTRRVVIATMNTFATPAFQDRLRPARDLLLVVDEVHRAGSRRVLDALERTPTIATLGLSATYRREWDLPGTDRLLAVMGQVLEPVIGIAEAIALRMLVPYDYRLITLQLNEEELRNYEQLTERIKRAVAQQGGVTDGDDFIRLLVLQRARILKQARGKVAAGADVLAREFRSGDRWLVYCDSQDQLRDMISACEARGLPAMEYHSAMGGDRRSVLESLRGYGGVVVAIRCLDEGVDIPACDRALIVASSTVEREYIQRRGRVLRTAPGKTSATVYDLLLTDGQGGALTRGEASRALEFARLARNPGARARLHLMVALSSDVEGVDFASLEDDEDEEYGSP